MRRWPPHRRLVVALATLLPALVAVPALAEDRALLVGVNDYMDQRVRKLRGCEDDARAVRQTLIEVYGFRENQIKLLLSREATREAIVDGFEHWLIDGTQPGDRVVFFESSHGSQKKCAPCPEEQDGFDEVLCPADYNPETQANAVIDDEIGVWLKRLAGRNVTLLVDSCHSGTITKSVDGTLRGVETIETGRSVSKYIPPPTKDIGWTPGQPAGVPGTPPGGAPAGITPPSAGTARPPAPVNGLAGSDIPVGALRQRDEGPTGETGAAPSGGLIDDPNADYIAFSACSPDQTAEEVEVEVGGRIVRRGAFTWFLVKTATEAAGPRGKPVSNRELLDALRTAVRDPRYDLSQTPELETRSAYFEQPFLNRSPALGGDAVLLTVEKQRGRARINRGSQHGIERGQRFVVCDGSAADAREVGRLEIENADQFGAAGRLTEDRGAAPGHLVRRATGSATIPDLTVFVEASDGDGGFLAKLTSRIQAGDAPGVRLVPGRGDAALYVKVAREGPEWTSAIYSTYGTLRSRAAYADLTEAVDKTVARLRGERLLRQLAALRPQDGDIRVELGVIPEKTTYTAYRDEAHQQQVRFQVRADRPCYVTLVNIDCLGNVTCLLPNAYRADNHVRAGEAVLIPADSDGFVLPIKPPAGRESVKAIATLRPLQLAGVNTKSLQDQNCPQVKSGDLWDAITRSIEPRAKPASGAPGGGPEVPASGVVYELPPVGWGIAEVVLDTVEEMH